MPTPRARLDVAGSEEYIKRRRAKEARYDEKDDDLKEADIRRKTNRMEGDVMEEKVLRAITRNRDAFEAAEALGKKKKKGPRRFVTVGGDRLDVTGD